MKYLFAWLCFAVVAHSLPQDRPTSTLLGDRKKRDTPNTDEEVLNYLSTFAGRETNSDKDDPRLVCRIRKHNQFRLQRQRTRAPKGINYHNLEDDEYIEEDLKAREDSESPIIPFKPGDMVYPNNIEPTTTRRSSPTTTPQPPTSTTEAKPSDEAIFTFREKDFDEPPVYPTSEKTVGVTRTEKSDDDDDDDDDISIEVITEGPEWAEDHPCRYGSLTHNIEVQRAGRRVSDIQCEYNMWHYKYRIVEAERKRVECDEIITKMNETKVGIIGGKKAAQGEFPHMGAVGWRTLDNDYLFMCGSSLISSRFSISAAHCSLITKNQKDEKGLAGLRPEVIRFGNVYIQNNDDPDSELNFADIGIDGPFIILKKYTFAMKYNDVALIRLLEDVKIEYNIRPACLWGGFLGEHRVANVTGWGQTSTKADSESAHLLFAELDFVDRETCIIRTEGRVPRKEWPALVEHQFCAGKQAGKVDTCQGDSGGPIQIQRPLPSSIDNSGIMYHVVGLTSFGIRCAQPHLPGIYVNVSDPNILCWIERTVWPEEPNEYCAGEIFQGYDPPST